MQVEVVRYIRECNLCCTCKSKTKKEDLYTPLLVPTILWENISMDFIRKLPTNKHGNAYLYVVLDRFSKMCFLSPCKNTITKKHMTYLFFASIWVHYGLPRSIVSDKDNWFDGKVCSPLWEKMNTRLQKSTKVQLIWRYRNRFSKAWMNLCLAYNNHITKQYISPLFIILKCFCAMYLLMDLRMH
jgi:hypothetical protein